MGITLLSQYICISFYFFALLSSVDTTIIPYITNGYFYFQLNLTLSRSRFRIDLNWRSCSMDAHFRSIIPFRTGGIYVICYDNERELMKTWHQSGVTFHLFYAMLYADMNATKTIMHHIQKAPFTDYTISNIIVDTSTCGNEFILFTLWKFSLLV